MSGKGGARAATSSAGPPAKRERRENIEMWIAKVPGFVVDEWDKRSGERPSDPVAQLIPDASSSTASGLPTRMTLQMADGSTLEFVPRPEYLPGSEIKPPTMVIVSDSDGTAVVEGKATIFADVRPAAALSSSYQSMVDTRKTRYGSDLQTQKMELDAGLESGGAMSQQFKMLSGLPSGSRPVRPIMKKREERAVDKRVRMDEKQLKSLLFTLFDKKSEYRFNELVDLTDQVR